MHEGVVSQRDVQVSCLLEVKKPAAHWSPVCLSAGSASSQGSSLVACRCTFVCVTRQPTVVAWESGDLDTP